MARVICTLPNASALINGVAFAEDRGQMVSEECSDEHAALFVSIPGYVLVDEQPPAGTGDAGTAAAGDTATAAKPAKGKAPVSPAA